MYTYLYTHTCVFPSIQLNHAHTQPHTHLHTNKYGQTLSKHTRAAQMATGNAARVPRAVSWVPGSVRLALLPQVCVHVY